MTGSQTISVRVVAGHQVASGRNGDPRFPGGTLRMQAPHLLALGFDISPYHAGTINVSLAPRRYQAVKAPITFRQVKWHPTEPAEDFSFFDVRVLRSENSPLDGKIYYPHPDTKPEHFQQPDVLELLLPFMEGLSTGTTLILEIPKEQLLIE